MNCRKCKKSFPLHVTINGKERNLCNRKYCLECSPFGSKNTLKLETVNGNKGTCGHCGSEFSYSRVSGARRSTCVRCRDRIRRHLLKKRAIGFMGGKCAYCGYNKSAKALHFHHLDPENKKFEISHRMRRAWAAVEVELKKCELVCSNCHAEKHDEEQYATIVQRQNTRLPT